MRPADEDEVTPQTTLAIILGAEKWLSYPTLDSSHYGKSATDFKSYLESPDGFGFPRLPPGQGHILWLFGTDLNAVNIRRAIEKFIEERRTECKPPVRDILFYYVGHGLILHNDFYLTIPETDEKFLVQTTLKFSALAESFHRVAGGLRCFLILDCCFAGKAGPEFEKTALSTQGAVLLCACLGNFLGSNDDGEGHTVLSGALLKVLDRGVPKIESSLSFRDLEMGIKEFIPQGASQPTLQTAHPTVDISVLPVFPNPATNLRRIQKELNQLKVEVAQLRELNHLKVDIAELWGGLNQLKVEVAQLRPLLRPISPPTGPIMIGDSPKPQLEPPVGTPPWWKSPWVWWLLALIVSGLIVFVPGQSTLQKP